MLGPGEVPQQEMAARTVVEVGALPCVKQGWQQRSSWWCALARGRGRRVTLGQGLLASAVYMCVGPVAAAGWVWSLEAHRRSAGCSEGSVL